VVWPAIAIALLLGAAASPLGGTVGTSAQPAYPDCDVSLDGQETIADGLLVAQHVVGLTTLTGQGLLNADCNGDTSVTIADGLLIAQRVVGLA
jgi:hypothetical protein